MRIRAERPQLTTGEIVNIAGLATLAFVVIFFLLFTLYGCAGAPPKPCSVDLETQYTTELVQACKTADAGSIEACRSSLEYAAVKAHHQAEQEDAGCRVGQ